VYKKTIKHKVYFFVGDNGSWAVRADETGNGYDYGSLKYTYEWEEKEYEWVDTDTVYIEARLNGANEGYLSYSY